MRVSLDWLKDFVEVKEGLEKIQQVLTMIGMEITAISNIEDDHIMEIEVTPNRQDCLSILGIAREFSVAIHRPVRLPPSVKSTIMKKGPKKGKAKVEILDKEACPRYVGCVMKNVKVGPSPKWLVKRLNALGVRAVNNIVDITNYVLFELGQPLHAFDLDKLDGARIIVRKAKKGETIVTIDGINRILDSNMLVIADAKQPVAIAGIMGGKDTEISATTKNILLESAYFNPIVIRRSSRQLGLASESSYRFERGVDLGMILAASARAQEMIKEIANGKVVGKVSDIGDKLKKEREITLCLEEIPRVLGIDIEDEDVMDIFKQQGFSPIRKKNKIFVTVPSYRNDLDRDIDLIEEIARFYGYDKIPVKLPVFKGERHYHLEKKTLSLENEIRRILCSLGMNEIITYTLTSRDTVEALGITTDNLLYGNSKRSAEAKHESCLAKADNLVRLQNPLTSQQEVMRPSLLSGMLEVLNWNVNRRNSLVQVFELNKVYHMDKGTGKTQEKLCLGLGMCGVNTGNWKEKSRDIDFFDLKGVVETLLEELAIKNYHIENVDLPVFKDTMSTIINVEGKSYGMLGEVKLDVLKKFDIKKRVFLSEIFIGDLLSHTSLKKMYIALPRFPSVKRDIAILVDDNVSAGMIYNLIKQEAKNLVKAIDVFDLYKGAQIPDGKKSLAYTIEYRSDEKTLKDEEVNEVHKKVIEALVKKLGVLVR